MKRNFPPPDTRRHLRLRAGLTQQELAEVLGINRATVARYELGQRKPTGALLARYAKLLDDLMAELAKQKRQP